MKKLNIQRKKLTKDELKNITGSGRVCWEGFCRGGEFEEWRPGSGDKNGFCC
ncbi:hypothetical protein [Chryseobacterium sp. Tr-659]|uniref:hypothetical protein n=1 Tax=Chryseobacterium sp. Tr-659 TaxID=2608340 RepID=UPI00141E8737|nr:hypothetical protein [Chryseobacterium sp. Tr-659]